MTKPSLTYSEKLKSLRDVMKKHGLDAYIVPRSDEYQGEFVAPYAERLKWLTGFTGSGGTALIFKKKALVLTDGRYLLQVKAQVDNKLFDTGDYVEKATDRWLLDHLKDENIVGYDPFLHTPKQIEKLQTECTRQNVILKPIEQNLVDAVWSDQPEKPKGKVKSFPVEIAGKPCAEKIKDIVAAVKANNAQAFIFTLPDSIAWILNIRGSDIDYIPSVLSYLLISRRGNVRWFVDPEKLDEDFQKNLGKKVTICRPEDMNLQFMALAQASAEKERPVMIDERYTPIHIKKMLEMRGASVKHMIDPSIAPKARKTTSEITAIRKAHIHDGIALVKFLKWLEENWEGQSEISAADALRSFRSQSAPFKGDSFPTIAGFGANGAIIHYRAQKDTNVRLEEGGLLLIDSGAQYAQGMAYGTTDITRTIAIGKPIDEIIENNTRVLKGHIGVAMAKFPEGTVGAQIDTLARKSLWEAGLDFAHGTGHGVGCYLAVHEEAASISSRGQTPFEEGMLISNEPGYYKEGKYGIRIENLIIVKKDDNGMLGFDTLSYAPIDKMLINANMLNAQEIEWIDQYHEDVYKELSPFLDDENKAWLKEKTTEL